MIVYFHYKVIFLMINYRLIVKGILFYFTLRKMKNNNNFN